MVCKVENAGVVPSYSPPRGPNPGTTKASIAVAEFCFEISLQYVCKCLYYLISHNKLYPDKSEIRVKIVSMHAAEILHVRGFSAETHTYTQHYIYIYI